MASVDETGPADSNDNDNSGTDQYSQAAADWLRDTTDFLGGVGGSKHLDDSADTGAQPEQGNGSGSPERKDDEDDGGYSDDSLGINDSDFVVGEHAKKSLLKKRMGKDLEPPQRLNSSPLVAGEMRVVGDSKDTAESADQAKSFDVGMRVLARYSGGVTKYEGEIKFLHGDGKYTIHYDDGEEEQNVPADC